MKQVNTLDKLFHNATDSTPGTVIDADWLNSVQKEICNTIEGFGGTLNPSVDNQLFSVLKAKVDLIPSREDLQAAGVTLATVLSTAEDTITQAEIALAAQEATTASSAEALSYKNTAESLATTATTQAGIATTKAAEALANKNATDTNAIATAADKVQTGLDRVQTGLDRTAVAADKTTTNTNATTATTQAGIATTKAAEALASATNAVNAAMSPTLKSYTETIEDFPAATGAVNIDLSAGNVHKLLLTGNVTLTFINAPAAGKLITNTFIIKQGGAGSFTVTWPACVSSWGNAGAPSISTVVGKKDYINIVSTDGCVTCDGFYCGGGY